MGPVTTFISAGLIVSIALDAVPAVAADLCVFSKSKKEYRSVPSTYGSCPENAANAQILEVPDVPDNFDLKPLAFRYAYFYPAQTVAYYTSCSGTGEATIKFMGVKKLCNLATE